MTTKTHHRSRRSHRFRRLRRALRGQWLRELVAETIAKIVVLLVAETIARIVLVVRTSSSSSSSSAAKSSCFSGAHRSRLRRHHRHRPLWRVADFREAGAHVHWLRLPTPGGEWSPPISSWMVQPPYGW